MSFKLTPFYTWVANWQQATIIGDGLLSQIPAGINRDEGVEFQFNKGDFSRNGFSELLAFTYTDSKLLFQNVRLQTGGVVPNMTIALNEAIQQYNGLTKAGGGSRCYEDGNPASCSAKPIACGSGEICDPILNPYYSKPLQSLLNEGGWYNPIPTEIAPNVNGAVDSYISPYVASLILTGVTISWRFRQALTSSPVVSTEARSTPRESIRGLVRATRPRPASPRLHRRPIPCNATISILRRLARALSVTFIFRIRRPGRSCSIITSSRTPSSQICSSRTT